MPVFVAFFRICRCHPPPPLPHTHQPTQRPTHKNDSMDQSRIMTSTETVCSVEVEVGWEIIALVVISIVLFLALNVLIDVREAHICGGCNCSSRIGG